MAAQASLTVGRLVLAPSLFSSGELTVAGVSTFHGTGANENRIGSFGSSLFTVEQSSSATFDGDLTVGGIVGDPVVNVITNDQLFTKSLYIGGSSSTTDIAVNISGLGSRIVQSVGETLTVGGPDGSAILRISNEAHMRTGGGQITVNETGWIAMFGIGNTGGGKFIAFGDVLVDGGRISGSGGSTFQLGFMSDMTVQNGGRVELDNHIELPEGSVLAVNDSIFRIDPNSGIAALSVGDGVTSSASASGAQSDFHIDGAVTIGSSGGVGDITLSNGAIGFFRFLDMGF